MNLYGFAEPALSPYIRPNLYLGWSIGDVSSSIVADNDEGCYDVLWISIASSEGEESVEIMFGTLWAVVLLCRRGGT